MNCINCGEVMSLEFVDDMCQQYNEKYNDHSHNVYSCECMMIAVERVWENKGVTFIAPDGEVIKREDI